MVQEEGGTGSGGITRKLDSIVDQLNKITEEKKAKEKKIKFPKVSKGKLKKNYVIVILLRTNKQIDMRVLPIQDNMVYLKDNETFHIATTDYVMRYKNYPVIILGEWDLQPISPDELMNKTISEKRLALPQKIIIQAMKQAQLSGKKKGINIGIILIVIGAIAAVVVVANLLKKKAA
jgi:hypothetical protein